MLIGREAKAGTDSINLDINCFISANSCSNLLLSLSITVVLCDTPDVAAFVIPSSTYEMFGDTTTPSPLAVTAVAPNLSVIVNGPLEAYTDRDWETIIAH